jgi:hypothetical protein
MLVERTNDEALPKNTSRGISTLLQADNCLDFSIVASIVNIHEGTIALFDIGSQDLK